MQVREDIKILVGNELSSVKNCPTTITSNNPCFRWILPDDLKGRQTRFCLQIKSHTPHILSTGNVDYAFYQSGDVESASDNFQVNYGTTGLLLQSWAGVIAVRLFISTKTAEEIKEEKIKIPYEYVSDDAYIEGTEWQKDPFDIADDKRYFVFDDKSETFLNANEIICRWKNSTDIDNDELKYFAQISKSPRFNPKYSPIFEDEILDNKKTYSKLTLFLENDTSYFFRVRAYDGIDYSDWSTIHGFTITSNEKPVAEITSIEYLEVDGQRNGNIKINFKITDTKQKIITLRLLYSGGSVQFGQRVSPCLLETAHIFTINEENKGCGSFTWLSLENEQGDADDFFLYLKANDGIDDSEEFVYGAFSIHNKSLYKHLTAGGSYFLTFGVQGKTSEVFEQQEKKYGPFDVPVQGREGIIKEYEYYGYQYDNSILLKPNPEDISVYGWKYPDIEHTFCVKTPGTIYQTIYHHGKYMIQDYMIPERMKEGGQPSNTGDKKEEGEKLEKDPYVIAPPFNPTLNVKTVGINKTIVFSSEKKLEEENKEIGKSLPLPNGQWFTSSEKNKSNGLFDYIQEWGGDFKQDAWIGSFVFEDDGEAPQYTLDVNNLDKNGYPKPISYAEYERIGENTTIYIKKYKKELGFMGNPKNFTVVLKNNKYERKYISCRGVPPEIVYENGIPYISYNGKLINKYDEKLAKEKKWNFPENTVYFPQSIWKKEIKFQHIAVPYYVPSTDAIYRPGDHKSGVVGKSDPIIVDSSLKTIERIVGNVCYTVPTNGELKPRPRLNEFVSSATANSKGIFLTPSKDVFINEDKKIVRFIDNQDDLYTFLDRNRDVVLKREEKKVTIYRNTNFNILKEISKEIKEKDLSKYDYPYYICGEEVEGTENEDTGLKDIRVKYFIFDTGKIFDLDFKIDKHATKLLEINLEEKLYYGFVKDMPYLLPQDYGIPTNGEIVKKQRYLPKVRKMGKSFEKFDFIDYICGGRFVGEETMYYAGVNGWQGKEVVDDYNRAIKFICNIKLAEKLQELKIIYLQYYWDSYNEIHWTGNLGSTTYVRIEYTKLINGKEVEWKDLRFKSSVYNEDIKAWLVKPLKYSALIDNFDYKQFEDECQYRMRISGVSFEKNIVESIGPVIASPDFMIDDDAVNPFVVESMYFDPWTNRLEIKFRVDDIQGDLYDIVSMSFTKDDKTWEDIDLVYIVGNITNLKSNTIKNRETNQIITHTIYWSMGGALSESAEIRIQIKGTLSKYVADYDFPFFSWVCWDNQKWKLSQDDENYVLGKWIKYEQVTNKDGTTSWKELENPVRQSGGEMQLTNNAIKEIKNKYETYKKSEGEEAKSYDEWLKDTYYGSGITYGVRLQYLNETLKDLQERLNKAKKNRFEAELFTRKELIKQGFYCNGFVNNDPKDYVFEYRVLNLPSRGHASTIDWGGEAEKITELNGDFSELTKVLENAETLKQNGFKIIFPIPVGIAINDETFPAKIEVVVDDSDTLNVVNYLHIDNTIETIPNRTEIVTEIITEEVNGEIIETPIESIVEVIEDRFTSFEFLLNVHKYNMGKYTIFFNCFTNKPQEENVVEVYLERYKDFNYDVFDVEGETEYLNESSSSSQTSEEEYMEVIDNGTLFDSVLLKEIKIQSKDSKRQIIYYNETKEVVAEELKYSKLVFRCKGDLQFANVGVVVGEEWTDIGGEDYRLTDIIVKGKIGERKSAPENETIGKHLNEKYEEFDAQDKYSVYYRFQMDFNETFDSQKFGEPLRDIIYTNISSTGNISGKEEEMSRITGGKHINNPILINKDVMLSTSQDVITEIEKISEESKTLETETSVSGNIKDYSSAYNPNDDKRKMGSLIIPKSDLPGQWKKKYLNDSYPEYYDKTKFASGSFNGRYYWRFAPYNVVECNYEEVSHSLIKNISSLKGYATIKINGISNENINSLNFNGNLWYKMTNEENPYWCFDWLKESKKSKNTPSLQEHKRGLVEFPTDIPRDENGMIIKGQEAILHIPISLEKTRPFVVKDNDELNYYMFYSKPGNFGRNVIIQSMGKSWTKFGELSQIYPHYIIEDYPKSEDDSKSIIAMFYPCALMISLNKKNDDGTLNIMSQKKIRVWATAQTKENKLTAVMLDSNIGKVDFDNPIMCSGLDNTYHHTVIETEEGFIMVCLKTYLRLPCLFAYTSENGIDWKPVSETPLLMPDGEISSPCINKEQQTYKIYLTEWKNSTSKIISYETKDFVSVFNKRTELESSFCVGSEADKIIYENPKNPCVIDDVYMGNKVKRMFYNVDVVKDETRETVIKTMFLETAKWNKVGCKVNGSSELSTSIFGKENILNIELEAPISIKEVRLEIELSEAYTKMPKECILQSDWITPENCSEYDAEMSPSRSYAYNSILIEKKYTGE